MIVWFLTKRDYITRRAQEIIIQRTNNMNTFMKSDMNNVKNSKLFKMLERTIMYNFEVEYRPGNQIAVADWGSRSQCTEGTHEDFITKNSEMGITVKSLRVKQLDLHVPKLEDLAAIGANDPEYQQMIRHLERGIQEI